MISFFMQVNYINLTLSACVW